MPPLSDESAGSAGKGQQGRVSREGSAGKGQQGRVSREGSAGKGQQGRVSINMGNGYLFVRQVTSQANGQIDHVQADDPCSQADKSDIASLWMRTPFP